MEAIITSIVTAAAAAIKGGLAAGKTYREALADSLQEAADKIRKKELIPDEAIAQAEKDQANLEADRDRFKD